MKIIYVNCGVTNYLKEDQYYNNYNIFVFIEYVQ